jgi:hypothetical protein
LNNSHVSAERRDQTAQDRDEQLALILDEYLAEMESGLPPDADSLLREHPELADELSSCLESLQLVHDATRNLRTAHGAEKPKPAVPRAKRIGEYRLIREIGRGGMGIVYEAHQDSLNRRVALKILPFAAVLDQRQIARFRNEAQAAAQLHHPNIVPVFAVGQERGVYYYAMQFIEGRSLDEVVSLERSDAKTIDASPETPDNIAASDASTVRLRRASGSTLESVSQAERCRNIARLGVQAAEALGHAHEVGIVHRDIKPSNLLLDHQSKLWITDFGLARMQTEASVTMSGDVVGTLRYMSPEQASGRPELVDSRTDIYSLGATLYELLTLEPALPGDDRNALMRRLEQERITPLRQLNSAVPVDLETIVHHAMAAVPQERYATGQELADDLNRFLAGKSPRAQRPTLVDHATRWTRRHRSLVTIAAASVVLMSILSTVGMFLLARESSRKEAALHTAEVNAREARENLQRAEEHYRLARDVVDRFGIRTADRLIDTPGTEEIRDDLIADTLGYYEEFVNRAQHDPQLRDELALAHYKSGVLAARLGRPEQADIAYRRAKTLLTTIVRERRGDIEARSRLALAHNNLGLLLVDQNKLAAARKEYEQAIALGEKLVKLAVGRTELVNHLSEAEANHGMLLFRLGQDEHARQAISKAIARLQPLVDEGRAGPRLVRNLAICYNNYSHILRTSNAEDAEQASRRAVDILQRLIGTYPNSDVYQGDLALCYNNLATILSNRNELDEAVACYRHAAELQLQMARKAPSIVRHRSELAISLNNLGVVYCRQQLSDAADQSFQQARQVFETLADDYPHQLQYRSGLAALLNNQGLALVKADRPRDALPAYDAAVAAQRTALEQAADSEPLKTLLSRIYFNQSQAYLAADQPDAAARTATTRRQLWADNGPRLFGVAVELATLLESLSSHAPSGDNAVSQRSPLQQQIADQAVDTLHAAVLAGYRPATAFDNDDRLASLRDHPNFAAVTTIPGNRADMIRPVSNP